MPSSLIGVFLSGVLSAAIFLLVVASGLGFFFLFLPLLPLFHVGLSLGGKSAFGAGLIAALIIALAGDIGASVLFFLMLGLPAWYVSKYALLFRDTEHSRQWYPLGLIWAQISLYACLLIACIAGYYAAEGISLETTISDKIRTVFSQAQAEYAEAVNTLAAHGYLVFPMAVWSWGLFLFGLAWFAQRGLAKKGKSIRPDFAVQPFLMPNLTLALLAAAAVLSLSGGEIAFAAKALLLCLLFPYFFLGAAWMHAATHGWQNRKIFLFFIYFFIFLQFWPALCLAGAGVFYHIKRLSGASG